MCIIIKFTRIKLSLLSTEANNKFLVETKIKTGGTYLLGTTKHQLYSVFPIINKGGKEKERKHCI